MDSIPPAEFRLVLPDPLMEICRTCEVICVAGCCGLDAFDRDFVGYILPWLREHPDHFSIIRDQLSDAIRGVSDQRGVIISHEDQFNAMWKTPGECVQFLRDWRETILKAAEKVYGQPLPAVDPQWRTSTTISLAQQMYESRDFSPLPILADALQDAGCDNDDMLNHCRDGGPHARGCWVVDLVLGKA